MFVCREARKASSIAAGRPLPHGVDSFHIKWAAPACRGLLPHQVGCSHMACAPSTSSGPLPHGVGSFDIKWAAPTWHRLFQHQEGRSGMERCLLYWRAKAPGRLYVVGGAYGPDDQVPALAFALSGFGRCDCGDELFDGLLPHGIGPFNTKWAAPARRSASCAGGLRGRDALTLWEGPMAPMTKFPR